MLSQVIRPIRRVVHALVASDSPKQLAAGFAIGMVLGLLPKGNLIALSIGVLLFSMRVNTGLGLVAAIAFSWIGPALDPFADKLGYEVLSAGAFQATYASVLSLPLGPWIGFNNTVVMGLLLIGLYFMYPVYWFTFVTCRWTKSRGESPAEVEHGLGERFGTPGPNGRRAA